MEKEEREIAFDSFLDNEVYDRAADAIYVLVKAAFNAGWDAAEESRLRRFEIVPKKNLRS